VSLSTPVAGEKGYQGTGRPSRKKPPVGPAVTQLDRPDDCVARHE